MKQVGVTSCALSLLASGIGTGVLVVPYAMRSVGWGLMFTMTLVGAVISGMTTFILFLAATQDAQKEIELPLQGREAEQNARTVTYPELLVQNTSKTMGAVLDGVFVCQGIGTAVGNFIFINSFLQSLPGWPFPDRAMTIRLNALALFPLAIGKSAGVIARLGTFSVASILLLCFGILYRAPAVVAKGVVPIHMVAEGWYPKLPETLCLAVFAFHWHNTSVHSANLLASPTPRRCAIVVGGATGLLFIMYMIVAGAAYYSFGDTTQDNIVTMYDDSDPLFLAIRCILTLSVSTCMTANIYPARDSILLRLKLGSSMLSRMTVSALLLIGSSSIAIRVPQVKDVVSLVGGTLCASMMLIFPAAIARCLVPENVWKCGVALAVPFITYIELGGLGLIGDA
jgi:amino acid permease